jgi:hypothetical protein
MRGASGRRAALDDDEAVATVLRQALRIDVGHGRFLSLRLREQWLR